MPRIFIDADSCPVKDETYKVAKRCGLDVVLVAAQWLRVPTEPWISLEVVKDEGQLDAADDWIVDHAEEQDIVVTEDILLAGRCLEKRARVVSPRGRVFTTDSIGEAIAIRELGVFGYLKHLAVVQGPIVILMFPLEVVTQFARVVSLALRLFANIYAKEVVLVVMFGLATKMFYLPVALPVVFIGILASLIQAFIFSMLTLVFAAVAGVSHDEH